MHRNLLILVGMLWLVAPCQVADFATTYEGKRIPILRSGDAILIHVKHAAGAFGWDVKFVNDDRLLVACRVDICVPLRLEMVQHTQQQSQLYVDADALGQVLGFATVKKGDAITLRRRGTATKDHFGVSAYHADWGKTRGFLVGQTLPDIPLIDLGGNEVRFGKFLGKRYIIYGWASW